MHQTCLVRRLEVCTRLSGWTFKNPGVGASANVLIVCQDVLEGLMKLVLLVVIGITLLCAFPCAA